MDKEGVVYTATRDGWIKRLHKNGSLENWRMLEGDTLLGITITEAGDLIVCDSDKARPQASGLLFFSFSFLVGQ